jgi:hypothetical protein
MITLDLKTSQSLITEARKCWLLRWLVIYWIISTHRIQDISQALI